MRSEGRQAAMVLALLGIVAGTALVTPDPLQGQVDGDQPMTGGKSVEWVVAATLLAAPASLRDGAEVRAWTRDGHLVVLKPGSNELICLADDPSADGFHAACYADALEPFMKRGRELKRQGVPAQARNETRWREIDAEVIPMPSAGAVYNLRFADDDFDASIADPASGTRLHAIYIAGATAESTGLPVTPSEGPWLMLPGTPSAHVMISLPARPDGANPEQEK